jgi:glycine dehydrogenase subunit 2
MSEHSQLRRFQAPVWDEPVIMEMGVPGRRGMHPPRAEAAIEEAVGRLDDLLPATVRRASPPELPEMSEPDVLRHYLHLAQETLGMMGISLFGTCTMKYNPRVNERLAARPEVAQIHPAQPPETMQGLLEIVYRFDKLLRSLSGMDRFVFQAAGGADAAYLFTCLARAYHGARGELGQRNQIITSIQSHPCSPATADAAGFEVINLSLGEKGYPSLEALKAAVSDRTAALMINNPDDMGIYNPEIKEWVRIVHEAGGLCFYDHANFNGVMTKIRARELGFDACMFMLHKTFGVPKGGGGPAVGAFGCSEELVPYLPGPLVEERDGAFTLRDPGDRSLGKVREYMGNLQQVMKAYGWTRAMGFEGLSEAADISVILNNYMEKKLLAIRGVSRSHPDIDGWRLEMTRYSLQELFEDTGVTIADVQNRMVDYGVDAFWMAHEPWIVPHPFTPETGEMWSLEDVDYWIAVLARVCEEAYTDPELVQTAPHNQAIQKVVADDLDNPDKWAMTWRAWKRKRGGSTAPSGATRVAAAS